MLDYFATAPDAEDAYGERDFCRTLSHTAIHTREDDCCDPILTTRVVQITDTAYGMSLARAIRWSKAYDEARSVEEEIMSTLENFFAPPTHCYHEWDCCGCRTGSFTVRHVAGAVFICQSATSRNF